MLSSQQLQSIKERIENSELCYMNVMIGTMDFDGSLIIFGTAMSSQRGQDADPPKPPHCTKQNNNPCTSVPVLAVRKTATNKTVLDMIKIENAPLERRRVQSSKPCPRSLRTDRCNCRTVHRPSRPDDVHMACVTHYLEIEITIRIIVSIVLHGLNITDVTLKCPNILHKVAT